jgi:hypothetical protein
MTTMFRLWRLLAAIGLVLAASTLIPRHACRLSSPPLALLLTCFCLILLPVLAWAVKKPRLGWSIVCAAPFITFGLGIFYVQVLHWETFPRSLLNLESNLSSQRACHATLQQIQGAKAAWATELHKGSEDTPSDADLFGTNAYIRCKPECPSGGTYKIGLVGQPAICTARNHTL